MPQCFFFFFFFCIDSQHMHVHALCRCGLYTKHCSQATVHLYLLCHTKLLPSCNHLTSPPPPPPPLSSAADSVPAGGPGSCGQPRATPQEAVKEEDRTLGWDIKLLCYMYMSFVWEDVREGRWGGD